MDQSAKPPNKEETFAAAVAVYAIWATFSLALIIMLFFALPANWPLPLRVLAGVIFAAQFFLSIKATIKKIQFTLRQLLLFVVWIGACLSCLSAEANAVRALGVVGFLGLYVYLIFGLARAGVRAFEDE